MQSSTSADQLLTADVENLLLSERYSDKKSPGLLALPVLLKFGFLVLEG